MKLASILVILTALVSCKGKPTISLDDREYVRTSLDLMRVRARVVPGTDTLLVASMLDSVYRRHHTSAKAFIKQSAEIGREPKRAELVYNTLQDSVGVK